jgi:2-keto-3-deoxy-6-phosphogluconate aldolase
MAIDFSALLSHRVIPVLVLNEPKKAKAIIISNTKPGIKKREAEPIDSDSTISSKL